MNTLTVQAMPATRVPERALALIDVLWSAGQRLAAAWAAAKRPTQAPSQQEVRAWSRELDASKPRG